MSCLSHRQICSYHHPCLPEYTPSRLRLQLQNKTHFSEVKRFLWEKIINSLNKYQHRVYNFRQFLDPYENYVLRYLKNIKVYIYECDLKNKTSHLVSTYMGNTTGVDYHDFLALSDYPFAKSDITTVFGSIFVAQISFFYAVFCMLLCVFSSFIVFCHGSLFRLLSPFASLLLYWKLITLFSFFMRVGLFVIILIVSIIIYSLLYNLTETIQKLDYCFF